MENGIDNPQSAFRIPQSSVPQSNALAVILVVDDMETNRMLLESMFSPEWYTIRSAASGEEALASVAQQPPDLILLDIIMPGIDGFEVTRRLKADPRTRFIPIILVTSLNDSEARLKGLEAGADEFLPKSVDRAELLIRVNNLLKIKEYQEFISGNNTLEERGAALSAALHEARQKTEQARMLFEHNADGIIVIDRDSRICAVNPAAAKLFERTANTLLGEDFGRPITAEETAEIVIPSGAGKTKEVEMRSAETIWEGEPAYLATLRDITEHKRAETELRIAAVTFETQQGIVITDRDSRILRVNKAFTRLTGYSAEEAIGKTPALLKSGRHDAAFYRDMWETLTRDSYWEGEIWDRRKDGTFYPKWLTITAVTGTDGRMEYYVGTFFDLTSHKLAEEMRQLAMYDPLTGLPNRRLLLDRMQQAVIAQTRSGEYGVLMFLDLDNFKPLNDTHGHDVGDLLLTEVARRITGSIRAEDTAARLGGDEFVVMLGKLHADKAGAMSHVHALAKKIRAALAEPYLLQSLQTGAGNDAIEHHCTASIGLVLFNHEATPEEILKRADSAMYQAKAGGRNQICLFEKDVG